MTAKRPGRPPRHEPREALQLIGFKADAEVVSALQELERALPGAIGRRSQAIRKAILEARDRLRAGG